MSGGSRQTKVKVSDNLPIQEGASVYKLATQTNKFGFQQRNDVFQCNADVGSTSFGGLQTNRILLIDALQDLFKGQGNVLLIKLLYQTDEGLAVGVYFQAAAVAAGARNAASLE